MADLDIATLVAQADLPAIAAGTAELKQRGREYVCLCPFHSDSDPSCTFFNKSEKWQFKCFVCGEGGDTLDWLEKAEGLARADAIKRLQGVNGTAHKAFTPKQAKPLPERRTSKPPSDAPAPEMALRGLGEPVKVWPYRNTEGELLFYAARYAAQDGGKDFRCWTWGMRGTDEAAWGCAHWNRGERPLYGLDLLARKPASPVMLVEGEKSADAARVLLPQYVVLTWPGGANAWKHADWSPLSGKRVDLWPDNDEPGRAAMAGIAGVISDPRGLACYGKLVDPRGMPDGGDAADWDGTDVVAWLTERASWYRKNEDQPAPPPPQRAPDPEPDHPHDDLPPPEAYADDAAGGDEPPEDDALPVAMSEDFLADKFAEQHANRWRYVKPWGAWFEWRGDGWYRDDTAKVDRLAVELTRQAVWWPQARELTPAAKKIVNSRRTAGAVRDLSMSDRRIAATVDQWDRDVMLLGVPGGVVDLRDGKLHPAEPSHYITKRATVAPAAGDAPMWRSFLETVTAENAELITFLQTFSGYCLTGETREQCFAFLYGTGQNGKGVFINALRKILGDYASTAGADVFMESDHNRHPTEMARLRGARLVTVDETDGRKRWNEERVKRITGGGKIEAHFMRQDDFEFEPQFKILVAGNHKPQLRGVGKAIQRRIHLIPFTVTIPDSERDDKLSQKLEAEHPQILAWMIEGCMRWQADGLNVPPLVKDATNEYIAGQDTIGDWLEEKTEQKGRALRPQAYKNYKVWTDGRGEHAWSAKAFWSALEERGYNAKKSDGDWYIQGLQIKLSAPQGDGYDVG